jgi:hypothetical protein
MFKLAILAGLGISLIHAATPALDPQLAKDWMTSKEFTLAVADAMPADTYDYRAAAEEMPVGALMIHIAVFCGAKFGQTSGLWLADPWEKSLKARHIVKELIPDSLSGARTLEGICKSAVNFGALDRADQPSRIRVRATAVSVQHEKAPENSKFVK